MEQRKDMPAVRARGRARPPAEREQVPRPAGAWGSGNPLRVGGGPRQPQGFGGPRQPQGFGGGPGPSCAPPQPMEWEHNRQKDPRRAAPPPAAERVSGSHQQAMEVAGDGNGREIHSARGAMRGRRIIPETTLTTRMASLGKRGNTGDNIALQTNYFRLDRRSDWCIFQYRVDFAPELDVTLTKKRLFYTAVAATKLKEGLFDGTVLYSPYRMNPDPQEFVVASLTNSDEKVRIAIRMVGELEKSSYQYIQVYNLILRKCMGHLKLQQIKRDYFDPMAKILVNQFNLELWPGFLTSIRQHEADLLLCVDIKHKIMKTETALNVLMEMSNDRRDPRDYKVKFRERMLNAIVLTDYNNKTYRVDDVDFDKNPGSSFTKKDGSAETFANYYRSRYGLTVRQMRQPLLVSKVKPAGLRGQGDGPVEQTVLLIPEFCRMTGLTERERTNQQMKRALEAYIMPGPEERINHLRKFANRLQGTPGSIAEMSRFDLELSRDIVTLSGRKLPTEELIIGPKMTYSAGKGAEWTREMRSKPMYRNGKIDSWAVVYSPRDARATEDFLKHIKNASSGMRWSIPPPIKLELQTRPEKPHDKAAYARTFEQLFARSANLSLVFVVVPPNKSSDIYSFVKKKLTVEKGVPSQCVSAGTCGHKSAFSIATKVAIQMNCKVGGAPWTVKNPLGGLMVMGYDACHDPGNKGMTYGAFVASYDPDLTAYYSEVFAHGDGEELSNHVSAATLHAVNTYAYHDGGNLPKMILFYRDGVGEGQLPFVYDHELKSITDALKSVYLAKNQQLKFRMIIVNKRINTRLFYNGRNPPAGTVVDDVITLPERSDFFLVSQCTNRGTVSPTYFSILGPDDFGLNSDKTQILTNRLCHQYYNWCGTVRVPAPCQYAHKLAFLAAQSLQRAPNGSLSHLLHFL